RHAPFVRRLVGEHRLAGDVADGEDVLVAGALLAVHFDETAIVHGDAGIFQPQVGAVGPPTHADEHAVKLAADGPLLALHVHLDALARVAHAGHFRAQVDRVEEAFEAALQRLDQVAVAPRQQAVGQLDHADLRAQLGVDGAHLQADVPVADD